MKGEIWKQSRFDSISVSNLGRILDSNYKGYGRGNYLSINNNGKVTYKGKQYHAKEIIYNTFNDTNIPPQALTLNIDNDYRLSNIVNLSYTPKEDEEFKDIPGIPKYRVSNYGTILNQYNVEIKRQLHGSHVSVGLKYKNKKTTVSVSRLVYSLFVGNIKRSQFIDYIDNNPYNTYYKNLTILKHDYNHEVKEHIECLSGEVWKQVPGYNRHYISNFGRLKSLKYENASSNIQKEVLLTPTINKRVKNSDLKYYYIKGTSISVGSLIYKAFIGPIPKGHTVLGDKLDNITLYNYYTDSLAKKLTLNEKKKVYYLYDKFMNFITIGNVDTLAGVIKMDKNILSSEIWNCIHNKSDKELILRIKGKYWVTSNDMKENMLNERFKSNLTINYKFNYKSYTYVVATCDCGKQILKTDAQLKYCCSCGCYTVNRKANIDNIYDLDKVTYKRLHKRYCSILNRCGLKGSPKPRDLNSYANKSSSYSSCGITVSKFYLGKDGFRHFEKDLIDLGILKNINLTVDRIDPNGDYAPWNIQLLSISENSAKARYDEKRSSFQLKLDKIKYERRKKNWIKQMIKQGYRKEDLI